MTTSVIDNPDAKRYEVVFDGEIAGWADYERLGPVLALTHTEIGEAYGGKGLARVLATGALDDARSRSLGVLPFCSFICGFVKKNPEYVPLVPSWAREHFEFGPAPS